MRKFLYLALTLVVVFGAGYVLGLNAGGTDDSGQAREYIDRIAEKDREIDRLHSELIRKTAGLQGTIQDLRAEVELGIEENRKLGELIDGAAGDGQEIISGVRGLNEDISGALELLRELRESESSAKNVD
ncbi:hypothetical protein [Marispirochaeta aestuarii]|uniref:hypothetical protein n=1 Tax=Marispirochaeta aestuarii TaxID=1963862 RepID=UPI002ABD70A5|nr:hypothetical protein [Marispirochaeta aestuarii]